MVDPEGDADAWTLAARAAQDAGARLRPLDRPSDPALVDALIERVWGPGNMPTALLTAFQRAGCVFYGAEAGDALIGFVLGFPGWEEGAHVHSHMLAVAPEWQSKGIGYALKLAQRAVCLEHGVDEVRWTYDPLLARNASFNLVRLGALATGFFSNLYGEMPDRLNRGDRSDRFEVRWRLRSAGVRARLEGGGGAVTAPTPGPEPGGPVLLAAEGPADSPRPKETGEAFESLALVAVPADHMALRRSDPDLAMRWRAASERVFRACFARGLVATWIYRDGTYRFERVEAEG